MFKLIIVRRENDYQAYLEDNPGRWDCGGTPNEAVGNWIKSHGQRYKIETMLPAIFPNVSILPPGDNKMIAFIG